MPSNVKADNQYFGKYRECCVVAYLNNSEIEYNENYIFTEEEKINLSKEAKLIADFLGNHTATYLGNQTINESGDIKLDNGEVIEIKSVSAGSGTYFNTSIFYFTKFGFDFKKYMVGWGLYDALEEHFGNKITVNRKNNSPVNQKASSFIRHNYADLYNKVIVPIDLNMRMALTKDIAEYFSTNPNKAYEFISDMLTKNSTTSKKKMPDRMIVLNYCKGSVREVNLKNFQDNISTNVRITNTGLVIGNVRVAFSWQNGVGLNNPTIRVFLED